VDQSSKEKNPDSFGIVYVATGQKYLDEAIVSATSCRAQMPHVPIHIFTDIPTSNSVFSSVTLLSEAIHRSGDKILPLMESPYQRTVFLDTDTYACGSFEEVFELLNTFDVAGVHSPKRISYRLRNFPVPEELREIPSAFTELNTGVLAFRKNAATDQLFREWHFWYKCAVKRGDNNGKPHDQPSFRVALFHSRCRYHVLTAEYNCRFKLPMAHCGQVKILHGRAGDLSQVVRMINSNQAPRAFFRRQLFIHSGGIAQAEDEDAEALALPESKEEREQSAQTDTRAARPTRRAHFTGPFDRRRLRLSLAALMLRQALSYRVCSGPFKGLRFHKPETGLTYYAKLLGTYEMELHPVIEELCRMRFERVVNAGAADGYYAAGLAYRMPDASIIAFEPRTSRQSLIKRLGEINHLTRRVQIAGTCNPPALSEALQPTKSGSGRDLVFMDVEGAEEALLDLKLVPTLCSAFIMAEIHEGARPGIGSRIAAAFASTHFLTVISTRQRRTEDFPLKNASRLLFAPSICQTLMNENRRGSIGWFYLRPKT
jgi:hypothetical protein